MRGYGGPSARAVPAALVAQQQAQLRQQLGARRRPEASPDVRDVVLHGARRDEDRVADLGVGASPQHELSDLDLAFAENLFRCVLTRARRGLVRTDRTRGPSAGMQRTRAGE